MNYTYTVDNYNAVDDLLGVIYVPSDETLSPSFLRVRPGDTTEQTVLNIHAMAPVEVWELEAERRNARSQMMNQLIGTTQEGNPEVMQEGRDLITATYMASRTLEEVRRQTMVRINAAYQGVMANVLAEYPIEETITFDKQEREARAWQDAPEGSKPATPYLDALLSQRPMEKAELIARVIAKADAFVAFSGQATGKRQRLEDAVVAATEISELDAIKWD